MPSLRAVLDSLLDGPPAVLPTVVDAAAERWAALRPRARQLSILLFVLALAGTVAARGHAADRRWGGAAVPVLVADRTLPVGAPVSDLRTTEVPPNVVPPGAVDEAPSNAVLALALPEGAILTRAHLDPRGPAAGLPDGLRAVPVPIEDGWAIVAGGSVDVWVLGGEASPAVLVAASRPVLEVHEESSALIGLDSQEVEAVTAGLGYGRLLLTHAPPADHDGGNPATR